MGENSNIPYCHHTFNPWIGCTKVSPGCEHCYAEAWDCRFSDGVHWGPGAPRRRTSVQNWNRVRRWNREAAATGRRTRVFCASLADVFDNEVPAEWREDLWQLIAETPALDWILVTKRVGNVAKMAPAGGFPPNVIILSTIVDQPEANRDMGKLVRLKRAGIVSKIGVSYEPGLGEVDWSPWLPKPGGPIYNAAGGTDDILDDEPGIDWLIAGGESSQGGATARPFFVNWARSAIGICRLYGVAVFIKQLGSSPTGLLPLDKAFIHDCAGASPSEWPSDLRVRQFPVIGGCNG